MSDDTTIFAEGLTRRFGPVCAVRELGLDVRRGEIFGLVGPDGAGKSTVMRMLAGVLPPDAGRIIVAGVDVVADPEAAKGKLSYMPQRFGLYEDLTVAENIFFYAEMFEVPRALRQRREAELLVAADLGAFRRRLAVQAMSLVVFARYYVTILRAVFLKGSPLALLTVPVLALVLTAALIIWLAARSFRKRLD